MPLTEGLYLLLPFLWKAPRFGWLFALFQDVRTGMRAVTWESERFTGDKMLLVLNITGISGSLTYRENKLRYSLMVEIVVARRILASMNCMDLYLDLYYANVLAYPISNLVFNCCLD